MRNRRIILFKNARIFINPSTSFTIEQTTFPENSATIKSHIHQFLEVNCEFIDGKLSMEIVNYNPSNTVEFENQFQIKPIKELEFKNLEWNKFEKLLMAYREKRLRPFLKKKTETGNHLEKIDLPSVPKENFNPLDKFQLPHQINLIRPNEPKHIVEKKSFKINIKYEDAEFLKGKVVSARKFRFHHSLINVTILNDYILPEFNTIKTYFGKKINGKNYFTAKCEVVFIDNVYSELFAISEEIDLINEALIEGVRKERIFGASSDRKNNNAITKSMDESELNNELGGDPFGILKLSGAEILKIVSEEGKIRNREQLKYLAANKHSIIDKLRFTVNPSFGFLFFIEGKTYNYFCWELLDTNATYLWSIPTSTVNPFSRIDVALKNVQIHRRNGYKKLKKNNEIDNDLGFWSIEHSGITSENEHYFEEWKNKLNVLTEP